MGKDLVALKTPAGPPRYDHELLHRRLRSTQVRTKGC
jgi:hypothetical protein